MPDISNCKAIQLEVFDDKADGLLSVGEQSKQIPFQIKRVYTITRLQHSEAIRGQHAHKKLEQVVFCLRGSAELWLDDGAKSTTILLDRPDTGIYLAPGIWHEVRNFQNDPILLVLASAAYDESDYVRNREEFLRLAHARNHSI